MTDRADLRATVADLLASLGRVTGDARFAHAAGVLRGRRAGRPAIDDGAAVSLAKGLVSTGAFRSRRAACAFVATMYADGRDVDAMTGRLQRKLRHK